MKTKLLKDVHRILERGWTTSEEIFRLSFGVREWPPNGVDKSNYLRPKTVIKIGDIKPFLKAHNVLERFVFKGMCIWDQNDNPVMLPKKLYPPDIIKYMSMLTHEAGHVEQDNSLHQLDEVFIGKNGKTIQGKTNEASKILDDVVRDSETGGPRPAKNIFAKFSGFLFSIIYIGYLGQDKDSFSLGSEIQARIHQLIAHNYEAWGRVPGTRTELSAAMYQLGIRIPKALKASLLNTAEGQKALDAFKVSGTFRRGRGLVRDINYGLRNRLKTKQGLSRFWTYGLPMMYGQLLEMYGDLNGRAKMGFEPKIFEENPALTPSSAARNNTQGNSYGVRSTLKPAPALNF
ncbi:MAG: hypothetical protein PHY92_08835 [Alphaproteobacteria bacterium]|nr:hypothetical protein [Alphaproteobacteria bacterium]